MTTIVFDTESKVCSSCDLEKPITSFYKRGDGPGLRSDCKDCFNFKAGVKWRTDPVYRNEGLRRSRKWLLKNRYGLSMEEYEELCQKLEYKCQICKTLLETPYIDHCHKTQNVRGLLCRSCNTGLGHFKDNSNLLLEAIIYLDSNI